MRISVCIASCNGGKYIKEQIDSILCQLSLEDEIIISDDSSTDNTVKIIKSINDSRIKVFENCNFKSPIFNFENAIKKASGEIIFLADQDDLWLPFKVEEMLDKLQFADIVVSNCYIGDDNLNIIKESYFEWRNSKRGFIKNLLVNSYLGCCMAFKRKMLKDLLPFPMSIPMHDIWIGVISEIYYKPLFLDKKLMIYRRHNGNTTKLSEDFNSPSSLSQKLMYRLHLLFPLVGRVFRFK
jgi:glycosyltransferase involved in cell wall biosynthesis